MRRASKPALQMLGMALVALVALASTGCGRDDEKVTVGAIVPKPEFVEVDREELALMGAENKDRPPVSYLLVASDDASTFDSEQALLDGYVAKLRDEGWRVEPTEPRGPYWWQFKATDGTRYASLGRLSVFVEQAGIAEGAVPKEFAKSAADHTGPLVVVSIET